MENIQEITNSYGELHIIIDRGNGEFTSMPKEVYENQQAEQSTPIVPAE